MVYNDEQAERFFENGVRVAGATTIQRSAQDVYNAWHAWDILNSVLGELAEVEKAGERTTRWTVTGPGGQKITWLADLIRDEPGQVIAWRTVGEPDVASAGSVRFRELPYDRGTVVRVVFEYLPPGGKLGEWAAKLAGGDPDHMMRQALHRFRQVMEAGEVAVAKGQPAGDNWWRSDRPGEKEGQKATADARRAAAVEM